MSHNTPDDHEFFRISQIAYDVGLIFGSTTDQGMARCKRSIYRAALSLAGNDRRWSWLKTKDSFNTVSSQREYSIREDVKFIHQMWMEGVNRQRIDRIPTSQFVEQVPNPELSTGIPRLFDEEGVDSTGAPVISLYPVPASALEVKYRFTRDILPFKDDSNDIRVIWGMPPRLLEALTQKAAALAIQGTNSQKFRELDALAESLIEDAYAADQAKPYTTYRAPMIEGRDAISDGPQLPPTYGRD